MEKKILISVAVVLITLAAISTFVDFSKTRSGEIIAPITMNIYAILTILVLIFISVMILRK